VSKTARLGREQRAPLPRLVVAISGPVRSGKTRLGENLERMLQGRLLRTRDVLEREYASDPAVRSGERVALQKLGDELDQKTAGEWVVAAVRREHARLPSDAPLILDAVRVPAQLERLQADPEFWVVLIYLNAFDRTLQSRYGNSPYASVRENQTERDIGRMQMLTWIRLNTSVLPETVVAALALAGIYIADWLRSLRAWPKRLLVGAAVVALPLVPIAWFWDDWSSGGVLVRIGQICFVALALLIATLVGIALLGPSPVDRDE
jgi:hypothetical protein